MQAEAEDRFCAGCGAALQEKAAPVHAAASASVAPPRAAAPTSLASGRYRIERMLGEGAKKRVYLARDERLARDVALALIKTEGLDEAGRARVRREAQAMGQLGDHPHVVTVHDIAEEGDQLYIVSQYMEGGDLEERLAHVDGRRLPIEEALRIGREICEALEHAHGRGVVHRDLKPGNIWLARNGAAALGDFGLAAVGDHSRLTQEGTMVGTVAYMAPEQALGRAADPRCDLYALGATLYEMVTGRPAFVGDDAVAIISQHINTPPVAPSWHSAAVPKALDALILGLLAKNPDERPESAARVRSRLTQIAASPQGEVAQPEGGENPLDGLSGGVFVGRTREVEQLRHALDETLSGKGRVALLVGEPGIGKTRTSEELATYAGLRGAQVLWGRCYEGEGAPTYWPWVQLIRAYVHESDPAALLSEMGAGAGAIAEVVSEVRERLPGLQAASPLEAEQARFRLFDAITSFLRNASQRQPLILVLDDLHWADKPSLLLLQFLARELPGSRLLVLGTYRDVELRRTHPLAEALAELVRMDGTQRIPLRGLQRADVARFIELSAGSEPPAALVSAVYEETEGNPFFVHEVVRLLVSEGKLEHAERVASWSVSIPQGIREVIGRRLNQLSEDCNRLLAIASVLGREFDLEVLEHVGELSGDRVLDLLEEAVAARVVEEVPNAVGRYRFCHALVRETLYEELSTTRRVRLHRRIAEVLEGFYGREAERHLAELAYHAVEGAHGGGDVERAIDYARRAGERAAALFAWEDAIPHYERALQALELKPAADDELRCDLLIALGTAQRVAFDRDHAAQTFRQAVEIARARSDAPRLARAAAGVSASTWVMGMPSEASVSLLEEALEALGDRDLPERVDVLHELVNELALGPSHRQARARGEEAVAVARRLGDPAVLLRALESRVWTHFSPDDLAVRVEAGEEAIRLARELGNPSGELLARQWLLMATMQKGDRAEFERHFREQEQLQSRTQDVQAGYFHQLTTASIALLDARWDEAERLCRAALVYGQRVLGENALQMFGAQTASLLVARGQLEEYVAAAELGMQQFAPPAWRCAAAWGRSEVGRREEARELLREICADDLAAIPWDGNWLTSAGLLSTACSNLGDTEIAAQLYERIDPYAGLIIYVGAAATTWGSTSACLGRLAAVLGRFDEAEAHFEAALELEEGFGSRLWIAWTRCELADLLRRRDRTGDRERALALANRALDMGRSTGTEYIVKKALALKLELQGVDSGETKGSIDLVASTVTGRRPDLGMHAAPDGTVTLMFSDMEGFTRMMEQLGDRAAHRVIRDHNSIVREQLALHGGHEVELQGDGFLLAFAGARRAVQCAIGIQRSFRAYNEGHPGQPIRVRIGLHTGEAIKDADKFFGKTVILASRIADRAEPGEILVSAVLKELVESGGDIDFRGSRDLELKGFSGRYQAFAIGW